MKTQSKFIAFVIGILIVIIIAQVLSYFTSASKSMPSNESSMTNKDVMTKQYETVMAEGGIEVIPDPTRPMNSISDLPYQDESMVQSVEIL